MKRILLMRHAKASRDEPGLADFDRPLAPRGTEAAPAMGAWIQQAGWRPEVVLCSAARRARDTLDGVWRDWPSRPPVRFEDALYTATAWDLLARLREVEAATASILVVGHNPTIQQAAVDLAGGGDIEAYGRMKDKFPTAALAVLEADVPEWLALNPGGADLRAFVRPRDLA